LVGCFTVGYVVTFTFVHWLRLRLHVTLHHTVTRFGYVVHVLYVYVTLYVGCYRLVVTFVWLTRLCGWLFVVTFTVAVTRSHFILRCSLLRFAVTHVAPGCYGWLPHVYVVRLRTRFATPLTHTHILRFTVGLHCWFTRLLVRHGLPSVTVGFAVATFTFTRWLRTPHVLHTRCGYVCGYLHLRLHTLDSVYCTLPHTRLDCWLVGFYYITVLRSRCYSSRTRTYTGYAPHTLRTFGLRSPTRSYLVDVTVWLFVQLLFTLHTLLQLYLHIDSVGSSCSGWLHALVVGWLLRLHICYVTFG